MSLPLSVLDLVPLPHGVSSGQAIRDALELAKVVDTLGYRRLWYAEHHNMATVASTTPEILIALAADRTERIRIGSGGIMLPNHAPLKVAESFKMLEALYPGRIDLGIGRAPGTDPATASLLRGGRTGADDFPDELARLGALGMGSLQVGSSTMTVSAMPEDTPLPEIFLLGSSGFSADLAAQLGLGFGFAAHFSDYPPEIPMLGYRERFAADGPRETPHAILTLSVVCAETDEEADYLSSSQRVAFARMRTGQKSILLPPEEALSYVLSPAEASVAQEMASRQIVGSPERVKARIEELAERTEADEVMITTFVHSAEARCRSYELVAGAMNLNSALVAS